MRGRLQSFALADAKLCDDGCKALRGRLQSFAMADAKLCVKVGLNRHRNACPILDKRKGEKDSPYGALSPQEISTEPITPPTSIKCRGLSINAFFIVKQHFFAKTLGQLHYYF